MSWTFRTVAVVGSGAIGLYYGGRLAAAGADLAFLARADLAALRHEGLRATSVHGDFHLTRVRAAANAAEIGPVDLVIVAWKATANAHLESILPPLLHENTQVLTLQNGLGNCEQIARITGPERVLGALCFVCINRTAPATIHHSAGGRMAIGEFQPEEGGRAAELARRFSAAGIQALAVPNLAAAQWEKLIWNIPFNGLSIARGGLTTDLLLACPDTTAEIRRLMTEVVHAARALGHPLADELIESNIRRTLPMGPYKPSSMIDYLAGREVETESIWAEPIRQAEAAGIPMPHTRTLLDQIHQRISEKRSTGRDQLPDGP